MGGAVRKNSERSLERSLERCAESVSIRCNRESLLHINGFALLQAASVKKTRAVFNVQILWIRVCLRIAVSFEKNSFHNLIPTANPIMLAMAGTSMRIWDVLKRALKALVLIFCLTSASAQQVSNQQAVGVAIMPFQNSSGKSNLLHWAFALGTLIKARIEPVKDVRIIPAASVVYALNQLELRTGQLMDLGQIRKCGQILDAEKVIYGRYVIEGGQLSISASIMNVVDGRSQALFIAKSIEDFNTNTSIVTNIISSFKIVPTAEEQAQAERPLSSSAKALELISRAIFAGQRLELFATEESDIKEALEIDPQCAIPLEGESHMFMAQGNADEALRTAKLAVKYRPYSASTHCSLGTAYGNQGFLHSAKDEFAEAIRLGPYNPDYYYRSGEVCRLLSKWPDAVSALKQAVAFSPYDANLHAELGIDYAFTGERTTALEEIAMAERYDDGNNTAVAETLAKAYDLLNDTPSAAKYYERYIKSAARAGIHSPRVESYQSRLGYLQASMVPQYIAISEPQSFSVQGLNDFLKAKLAPEERGLVVNPFSCNAQMARWASQLVVGAKNDEEKARLLFNGLEHRINLTSAISKHSAEDVYNEWTNINKGLLCQDYALLYVALARAVGLKAYFVTVSQDYQGGNIWHACVGVIIGKKALLVDPMYEWFGIPHKRYQFQNDVQVIAILSSETLDMQKRMLAIKLYPDWPMGYFCAAQLLARDGQVPAARQMLQRGLNLDSEGWFSLYVQAEIELYEANWSGAVQHARQCLNLNVKSLGIAPHYLLGVGLWHQGNLKEARQEFRAYLQEDSARQFVEEAFEAIASIDKSIRDQAIFN